MKKECPMTARIMTTPITSARITTALIMAAQMLLAGLLAMPAFAQDAGKKDAPPKPPLSPSATVLETWDYIGRKLSTMAEDFPEDKYDFRPNPAERTFAEQLLHAANSNYFFINPARGEKPPAEEDPKRDQFKTKADIVAFVKKAFSEGAAVIKEKGDKGMNDLLVDPFENQQTRVIDMAYGLIEHSGEHYGQLAVYYRVAGLVPPESRPKK
jgi:uncharacterized damage-inducible protein DinB